ncbi:glycosyltransferase family 39 protein [Listeria ivanovii subsp. londoniensis]|uniref:glycosyltransferase family 39 protein n=1 Tax=Listeria ivanovii TaxID=1638 RepID=UPI001908DAA4|nr:glycosyltransferase family 39 protein [Listeria ivanovii]MBK2003157.1 glycosyltransferase family 39 protein [Listeria ivanovii subsp. londoniensis]
MKNKLVYIFNAIFILIFGYLLCMSIFKPEFLSFDYPVTLIFMSTSALLVLIGIFQFSSRLNKKGDGFLTIFLLIMIFLSQIYMLASLQMDSFADAFVVKGEALKMLANGGHASVQEYFMMYPNNIFITIIRYWLYSLGGVFGITNTYLLESVFLFICMNITIFVLFWIVRKENGGKYANIYLIIVLLCVPLQGYIWYFYTDTLVLPFAALITLCYYQYTKSKKWWYFIIIGILFAIGYHIKPNVIILLPAMIIHQFFIINWRKVFLNIIILAIFFVSLSSVFTPLSVHYGFKKNAELEFPQTHWVMMGLGDPAGRYNRDDVVYTSQFKTKEEKQEANIKEIKERIKKHGPKGLLELYNNKMLNTWTDGTRAYTWYTNSALDYSEPYNYFFGDKRMLSEMAAQIFHIINLLLICLGALRFYKKREFDISFFINITLIGVWLFHLIWEANQRYILFVTPLMIVSSIYGVKFIIETLYTSKFVLKSKLKKAFLITSFLVFLISSILLVFGGKIIAGDKRDSNNFLIHQSYAHIEVPVTDKQKIEQTFKAKEPFNSVQLSILKKPDNESRYRIKITNESDNKIIYNQVKKGVEFSDSSHYKLVVNENPNVEMTYRIEISEVENSNLNQPLKVGTYIEGNVDLYPFGNLYINGNKKKDQDIGFDVMYTESEPMVSKFTYIMFGLCLVIIFAGTYYIFKRRR